MSTITTPDSLKMVREALCIAQAWLPGVHDTGQAMAAVETLQRLVDDIDRQRPLGPDGKHGDRHTPTCGCYVTLQLLANMDFHSEPGDRLEVKDQDGAVLYRGEVRKVYSDGGFDLGPNEIDVVTLRTGDGTAHEVRS